jgi:hypothetical protein
MVIANPQDVVRITDARSTLIEREMFFAELACDHLEQRRMPVVFGYTSIKHASRQTLGRRVG